MVDRDGARLLVVRRRPGLRAADAPRRARRAQLLRALSERERVAGTVAMVALFRLGAFVARRRSAARGGRIVGAVRSVAGDGVSMVGRYGNRTGCARDGRTVRGSGAAASRDGAETILG